MLKKHKRNKPQQHLSQLPKLTQSAADFTTLYCAADFCQTLLAKIAGATQRIFTTSLYLENDDGGHKILEALYQAKCIRPELTISILVDWHRAQRGRIGAKRGTTNADWYCAMADQYPQVNIPIYGVPINTREALGILHLKGIIIDDTIIYSGASLNDVYLHQHDKYRYDRYHVITNPALTNSMAQWITDNLIQAQAVHFLNSPDRPKNPQIKNEIRLLRKRLQGINYSYRAKTNNKTLAVTPLVGLGKRSLLNKTINYLMSSTKYKLILCTPYFNLPACLVRTIIGLLRQGKQVEIIVGDKTANDFYIPENQTFKIIGALPYLYEINLRRFLSRLQYFIDSSQLIVRIWKDEENSYHLKGIWVDEQWMLITGNNLNPRAWNLDLENAMLIHDPLQELAQQRQTELEAIRCHTTVLPSFRELDSIADYPVRVRRLIRRVRRIRIDRLINRIL